MTRGDQGTGNVRAGWKRTSAATMGIIKSFTDAVGGTLADQWKDIFTAPTFPERLVVGAGVPMDQNDRRGTNLRGSEGIITNGSSRRTPGSAPSSSRTRVASATCAST